MHFSLKVSCSFIHRVKREQPCTIEAINGFSISYGLQTVSLACLPDQTQIALLNLNFRSMNNF